MCESSFQQQFNITEKYFNIFTVSSYSISKHVLYVLCSKLSASSLFILVCIPRHNYLATARDV